MIDPNASMTALVEFQIRRDETTMDDWLEEWQKRAQDAVNSYFKQCFPGFQKYPDWGFLRKDVYGIAFR